MTTGNTLGRIVEQVIAGVCVAAVLALGAWMVQPVQTGFSRYAAGMLMVNAGGWWYGVTPVAITFLGFILGLYVWDSANYWALTKSISYYHGKDPRWVKRAIYGDWAGFLALATLSVCIALLIGLLPENVWLAALSLGIP